MNKQHDYGNFIGLVEKDDRVNGTENERASEQTSKKQTVGHIIVTIKSKMLMALLTPQPQSYMEAWARLNSHSNDLFGTNFNVMYHTHIAHIRSPVPVLCAANSQPQIYSATIFHFHKLFQ